MNEQTESSSDEGGERRGISVRCLSSMNGLTTSRINRAVRITLAGRPESTVSVAVVDDATLASLHKRYLDDPRTTDVLTFDLRDEEEGEAIDGEILVSSDAARRQARRHHRDVAEETLRYIIHGLLHLTGYDDGTVSERRDMRKAERRILTACQVEKKSSSGRSRRKKATRSG